MKSRIAILLLLLTWSIGATAKPVVAIGEFEHRVRGGSSTTHAVVLKDRILDLIHNSNKFEVVERDRLKDLLKEMQLVDAGMTEGDAPESNRLKAAGFLIYGSILQSSLSVSSTADGKYVKSVFEVQIRYSDGQSGKLLAVKTCKGDITRTLLPGEDNKIKKDALAAAIQEAALHVVNGLVDVAMPIKVVSVNDRYITVALSEEQTYVGEQFEVYELGEELTDPDTGEVLGNDEERIGLIEVVRTGAKLTRCKPCEEGVFLEDFDKGMVLRRLTKKAIKQQKTKRPKQSSLKMMR